jgi:hypothetical protein
MDRIRKINVLDWLVMDYEIEPRRLKDLYIECNTINLDLTIKLYRVLNYNTLLDCLKNKCLFMSKPSIWADPYETFLMNYKTKMKDGTIVGFEPIKERIYCQCWSTNEESEALWNVHSSPDFSSVKIKSCGEKLMEYLYDINNQFHYLSYFIGSVDYVSEEFIMELLNEGISKYFSSMTGGMSIIQSLFIKRKAFAYEDEVRLVFNVPNSSDVDFSKITNIWDIRNNFYSFKIDINDLIEKITFHPNLKDVKCIEMENEIRKLGYTGEINRSKLFSKKDIIIDY